MRLRYITRDLLDRRGSWIAVVGAALLLRLLVLWQVADAPFVSDSLYYYEVARDIAAGEETGTYWPPGLPYFEAAVITVFGDHPVLLRVAMLFWFLALCWLLYHLLYRLHSRVAANLGLLVLAFYPAFVHHSVEPLTQLPAGVLLLGLFQALVRYFEARSRRFLWQAGFMLGLLLLFRPSAILFLAIVPMIIFLRTRKLLAPALVFTVAIMVAGTWIWNASVAKGRFIPINEANARNFYLGNNAWTPLYKTWYYGSHWASPAGPTEGLRKQLDSLEALPAEDQSLAYWQASLSHIGERPDLFVVRSLNRLRTFFAFDTFTGARIANPPEPKPAAGYAVLGLDAVFYCIVALGWLLFVFGAGKYQLETKIFRLSFLFLLMYSLPYFFSFSHPTYHLPVLPFLLIPGASMVTAWLTGTAYKGKPGWKAWVAVGLFLLMQVEWIVFMA